MKKSQAPLGTRPAFDTAEFNQKSASETNNKKAGELKSEILPGTISGRLALVFKRERLSPQKSRLLKYIFERPDAWTHQIAAATAVGFPPNRLGELNKEVLWRYGLRLDCHVPEQWLVNRYGDESKVHQWKLVLQPNQGREAA